MATQIKECNKRLIKEVAEELEITQGQVETVLKEFTDVIATVIKSGTMEGVSIPYLGKIQVKFKTEQYKDLLHSIHPEHKKILRGNTHDEVENLFKPNE